MRACYGQEAWQDEGAPSPRARVLPPLAPGDTVVMKDLQIKAGTLGRWTKTGQVIEVLPHDTYLIKVHGSRGLTQRNCRFLKKMTPFQPALLYSKDEVNHGRIVAKALLILGPHAPHPATPPPPPPPPTPTPLQGSPQWSSTGPPAASGPPAARARIAPPARRPLLRPPTTSRSPSSASGR